MDELDYLGPAVAPAHDDFVLYPRNRDHEDAFVANCVMFVLAVAGGAAMVHFNLMGWF